MLLKSHFRFILLVAATLLIAGCRSKTKIISDYIEAFPAVAGVVVIPDDVLQTDDLNDVYIKMTRVFINDIKLDDQNRLYLDATPKKLVRKYGLDERYYGFLVKGLKESNEASTQSGVTLTPEMLEQSKKDILSFKKARD